MYGLYVKINGGGFGVDHAILKGGSHDIQGKRTIIICCICLPKSVPQLLLGKLRNI